ncbi:MAG: STT3 domain-containing protein, partial [Candidatus Bathyarchaeia archaeon]
FIYQLLRAFGFNVSVYNVCLYFPVLMGVVTCVVVYFLGKDLGGSSVGLFSALFTAVSEAFISRTALGFFDTENIGIFGMAATSLFFLRSTEREKLLWEKLAYAAFAGLLLGLIIASWGASRYIVGLLTLYMVASLLTNLYTRDHLVSYGITIGVGMLLGTQVPKLGFDYLFSTDIAMFLSVFLIALVYEAVRERIEAGKLLLIFAGLVVGLSAGILGLGALGVIDPVGLKFLRVIDPRRALASPLYASVAEHKRSTWTSFFSNFGLTLPLGVLGTYLALKELDGRRLYGALYFVSAVYFAGSMTRLFLILSIPAALMASYGLKELLVPFIGISGRMEDARRARRRRSSFGMSKELAIVFSLFILVAALPTFWGTAKAANTPTILAASSIGAGATDWLQALQWMRDNLPDDAIVVSWWDYGYWIEALANKTTLADGATRNTTQIANIGKIMMFNQSRSIPILRKYNATYILVFNAADPNDPDQAIGHGDNLKWTWMVLIPNLNITDYMDETNRPTDMYRTSTLYRLMTRRPDTAFRLVFSSQYYFVLVYEIDYEAAQT